MSAPHQWPRIKEIVGSALECPPSERISYLDSACSGDDELRAEVDSLIAAYEQSSDLSSPPVDFSAEPSSAEPDVPTSIGPYRLVRQLGVGGMGQVWLAEQTEPVRRSVAIKLVRANLYHPEIVVRFLAERQSLASMNHPYIAKVLDGGATSSGQPYFVMEYVDGCSITQYCDDRRLPIAERLRLLQKVCEGVQHAHVKAIIHRDLKPSNILIEEVDGKPIPRIIDFGVAKAVSSPFDPDHTQTRAGSVLGTLGYMSPEQAVPGSDDIDTRTDSYALGVVLYELLTGTLPIRYKELTWYEAVRQLQEQEPPRPSTQLRTAANAGLLAQSRAEDLPALVRTLRGDLDSIVLKAIDIDRNRRYETPSALAVDIERFLRNEPVAAHAASVTYRARKYLRRHAAGALASALALLLLVSFAVAQTWQLRNTRRQRDRADRITEFMTNIFKVPDPSQSRGNAITARQILDQSAYQVENGRSLDPTVRQQLMQVMAETYRNLGIYDRARDLSQQVYEDRRRSLGPDRRETLESMTQMAKIAVQQGRVREAQTMLEQAVAQEARALGNDDRLTLNTREALAALLQRHAHNVEAERIERQIISLETARLGPFDPQTFASSNTLALALKGQSRFAEAEKLFRQLLAEEPRTLGPDHPYVLNAQHNLATMLSEQGRYREAEVLFREDLAIERRVLGPEHPDTADTLTTLASTIRFDRTRQAEAEALYRQALAIEERTVGPDHPWTTRTKEGLANNLDDQHILEARQLLEQVLATRQRTLGPDNTDTLLTGYNLACLLIKENRLPEAESLMRTTFQQQQRVLDANDPDTLASGSLLASILFREGRPQEAETMIRPIYEAQLRLLGPDHEDTGDSREYLGAALAKLGRYEETQALYRDRIGQLEQAGKAAELPDAWYEFAEAAAFGGHSNDAFANLRNSIHAGYQDAKNFEQDPAFSALSNDPRYRALTAAMQRKAALPPPTQ